MSKTNHQRQFKGRKDSEARKLKNLNNWKGHTKNPEIGDHVLVGTAQGLIGDRKLMNAKIRQRENAATKKLAEEAHEAEQAD